ncbi:MAG: PIN domain-containing protein [Chloroflexota bacterium]|nr:PIN domain-containing protein [Chloroflexota bacterium]
MNYVTDTHALVWHLTEAPRLSPICQTIFGAADEGENVIWIPSVALVEIVYLVEKRRLPKALIEQVLALVDPPTSNYPVAPLDTPVVRALESIDCNTVPDMPNRIIAATAWRLRLPLLSKDPAIAAVDGLNVIW